MIVQCEQCQTRFRFADDKVPEKGVRVRCARCGHSFRILRSAAGPDVGGAAAGHQPGAAPGGASAPYDDPFARFGMETEAPSESQALRPSALDLSSLPDALAPLPSPPLPLPPSAIQRQGGDQRAAALDAEPLPEPPSPFGVEAVMPALQLPARDALDSSSARPSSTWVSGAPPPSAPRRSAPPPPPPPPPPSPPSMPAAVAFDFSSPGRESTREREELAPLARSSPLGVGGLDGSGGAGADFEALPKGASFEVGLGGVGAELFESSGLRAPPAPDDTADGPPFGFAGASALGAGTSAATGNTYVLAGVELEGRPGAQVKLAATGLGSERFDVSPSPRAQPGAALAGDAGDLGAPPLPSPSRPMARDLRQRGGAGEVDSGPPIPRASPQRPAAPSPPARGGGADEGRGAQVERTAGAAGGDPFARAALFELPQAHRDEPPPVPAREAEALLAALSPVPTWSPSAPAPSAGDHPPVPLGTIGLRSGGAAPAEAPHHGGHRVVEFLTRGTLSLGLALAGIVVLSVFLNDGEVDLWTMSPDRVRTSLRASSGLAVLDVSHGLYQTATGRNLFYVTGVVANLGTSAASATVRAELLEGRTFVSAAEGAVGLAPSPEVLSGLSAPDEAAGHLGAPPGGALPVIAPGERGAFTVVFFEYPPDLRVFRVRVSAAPGPSAPAAEPPQASALD